MSEARSLVNIIDDLEKKSEELESVIDMYNQIRSLESKLSDTVKKYENLLSLIEESDIKLDKSGQNIEKISIELSRSLKEHLLHIDSLKGSNEIIKSDIFKIYEYISDIKKELVQQDQRNELLEQKILDNQVILEHNFKGINQNLSDIRYEIENEKKTILEIKDYIDRYNNSLNDNLKKEFVKQNKMNELLERKILDNQGIMEYYFKGLNQSLSEIKHDVENEQETIIQIKGDIDRYNKKLSDNIKKNIENISNDLDKRFKTQNILIVIIIVFLIINIFFK